MHWCAQPGCPVLVVTPGVCTAHRREHAIRRHRPNRTDGGPPTVGVTPIRPRPWHPAGQAKTAT